MRVFSGKRLIRAGAAISAAVFLPSTISAQNQEPDTRPGVAVLRFESGGSLGPEPEDLGALEVGIQHMLLTELSQNPELRIVERSRMNAILSEQELGVSGRVEPRYRGRGRASYRRTLHGGRCVHGRVGRGATGRPRLRRGNLGGPTVPGGA